MRQTGHLMHAVWHCCASCLEAVAPQSLRRPVLHRTLPAAVVTGATYTYPALSALLAKRFDCMHICCLWLLPAVQESTLQAQARWALSNLQMPCCLHSSNASVADSEGLLQDAAAIGRDSAGTCASAG